MDIGIAFTRGIKHDGIEREALRSLLSLPIFHLSLMSPEISLATRAWRWVYLRGRSLTTRPRRQSQFPMQWKLQAMEAAAV